MFFFVKCCFGWFGVVDCQRLVKNLLLVGNGGRFFVVKSVFVIWLIQWLCKVFIEILVFVLVVIVLVMFG